MELCKVRLDRAEKLTTGLHSEHGRWKENVSILDGHWVQITQLYITARST